MGRNEPLRRQEVRGEAADIKISLARRNSRFSRSNTWTHLCSSGGQSRTLTGVDLLALSQLRTDSECTPSFCPTSSKPPSVRLRSRRRSLEHHRPRPLLQLRWVRLVGRDWLYLSLRG